MNVFELYAKIGLDSTAFKAGLKTAGKMAKGALVGATAAVGAFTAASVKTGAAFDKSMSQVAATMGKTVDEMGKDIGEVETSFGHFKGNLRDFAQYMGKNTAFSAKQAADALNYMALAGYNTQESMNMLPNVLSLAAAGDMDLAKASDMVTDTQTAFGISAERTTQMVDEMAKAASTGNTNVEQLGSAFLVVGGLAQELNGGMVKLKNGTTKSVDGIQEMEIAMTAMANAGIKGSEAGTHMRNMLMKLSKPTSEGTKALEKMGVSVFDAGGKMRSLKDIFGDLNVKMGDMTQQDKIQTIAKLFNARDLTSAEAILNAIGSDWDEIGEAILNADGAAAKMAATQLDNLAGDVTLFKSALEGAQIVLSDQVKGGLRDFVQLGTKGIQEVTDAFQSGGLTGAMSAFGDILAEGIGMLVQGMPKMVDAAVQLLTALVDGLVQNLPMLIQATGQIIMVLAQGIVEGLPQIAASIQQAAPQMLTAARELFLTLVQGLSQNGPALLSKAAEWVMNLAKGLLNALPQLLTAAANLVRNFLDKLKENLPQFIEAAGEWLRSLVQGIVEHLPEILAAAWDLLTALFEALIEGGAMLIQAGFEILNSIVLGIKDGIVSLLGPVADSIKERVMSAINALKGALSAAWGAIKGAASAAWNGIKSVASSVWNAIKSAVTKPVNALKSSLSSAWSAIKGKASSMWDAIKSAVTKPFDTAKQKVMDAVDKIKSLFPISLGKIFKGIINLPFIKVNKKKDGADTSGGTKEVSFAKAMNQPYLFDGPTFFKAGEAGDEMLYGKKSLMNDIAEVVGGKGRSIVNNFYLTVNGSDNPEDWGRRFVKEVELRTRMA